MTPEDLEAIRERWARCGVTSWQAVDFDGITLVDSLGRVIVDDLGNKATAFDVAAIVNAPTDIRALLAYVDELTARLASVRACDNCMQVMESRCSLCHSTGVVIQ